jgi:dTDP-4-dehydrorhamnose reductase
MLGHKMFQLLRSRYPDTACTIRGALTDPFYARVDLFRPGAVIEKVDAMDLSALGKTLRERKPRFLVNCIGIVKQRDEASAAIPSITLNALLPHKLAEFSAEWGGRVIHFSTDCVFDGNRGGYTEEDPSDATDLYGKTKYLGEVATENALTLRTSIIGRELAHFRSLLEWFLGQKGKQVRGYTRVIYSGVTTNHLADLVGDLIERHPELAGLYQVASTPISKHDLLCLLKEAFRLEVEILPDGAEVSDRSLNGDKFFRATGYICPEWPVLAEQLAADRTPYREGR